MIITPKDRIMFDSLSKSEVGAQLIDYLQRLSDNICDSRTWIIGDSKESATRAADYIEKYLKSRIVIRKLQDLPEVNTFE